VARDFSKNTSNHLNLGTGLVGALLNGAAAISVSAIITADTFTTTGSHDNQVIRLIINGTSGGLLLEMTGGTTGAQFVQISARSVSGDGLQTGASTSTVSTGTEAVIGGVADIANDQIRVYLNGAQNGATASVTFGNATYTLGTPSANDYLGGTNTPSNEQFDGRVSEVAIWAGDIGAAGFAMLGKRVSPLLVRPNLLVGYWPLLGNASPEVDLVSGKNGTITGTVAKADHPRITYAGWPSVAMTGSGGGGGDPYDPGDEVSLGSFNQMIFRRAWR
jgi:hypothetical protein